MLQVGQITVDCSDPNRLAEFWMAALGFRERAALGQFTILSNSDATGLRLNLQKVPEPKTVKNRVHFDLIADDRPAEVRRLEGLGAREVRAVQEGGFTWTILADPEGNEFCVVG